MGAAERWLRERGVPKLNLMVRTANSEVIDLYKALGYEVGQVVVLGKFLDR